MEKKIILSVGGSLLHPDKIDVSYIKSLKEILEKTPDKCVIYCGGGSLAREYIQAAKSLSEPKKDELDWIGIMATRINAELIRVIMAPNCEEKVIYNPTEKIPFNKKFLIAAGWKPGWSTDYDAVLMAKNLGIECVINLTDVDYVYDKNPKKFSDAKPFKQLTWDNFFQIVGDVWKPGLNAPFDPIAAKQAKKNKMKVIILNGKNLRNLNNYLSGKGFIGTEINL